MPSVSASYAEPRRSIAVEIAKGLAILAFQTVLTVAALFVLAFAVILASNAPYEDMLSVVGWVFWSALAAVVTTVAVVVLGLPIRLVPVLRGWWQANGEIAIVGGAIGVILVITAFLSGSPSSITGSSGQEFTVFMPTGWLLLSGWLLSGFSCAHLLWPRRWTRLVRRIVRASRGASDTTP